MSNAFYNASGTPATGSAGASSPVRTEFTAIQAGFDKMPALTAGTAVVVNSTGTALTNTVGQLALAGNLTLSGAFNLTLSVSASVTLTCPATNDTLVGRATTDTLTNKTLTAPVMTAPVLGTPASGTLTNCTGLPNGGLLNSSVTIGSTNVALGATAATIAGLTLTAPAIGTPASGTLTNCTGLPVSTGISGLGTGVAAKLALAIAGMQNYLTGLTLSAAGGTATFGIAAGVAADSTNVAVMQLSSPYTKTASAWAVGSGNGSLDTGAIANNTWYHEWLIQRSDTGVVDVLTSLSASAPTMPTNYDRKRRIGSLLTNGSGQWVKFSQRGDEFLWDAVVADQNPATVGTTASLLTLTVPTGVNVNALLNFTVNNAAGQASGVLSSPDVADAAVTALNRQVVSPSAAISATVPVNVRTNTIAQVRARADQASTGFFIGTVGFIDPRGK